MSCLKVLCFFSNDLIVSPAGKDIDDDIEDDKGNKWDDHRISICIRRKLTQGNEQTIYHLVWSQKMDDRDDKWHEEDEDDLRIDRASDLFIAEPDFAHDLIASFVFIPLWYLFIVHDEHDTQHERQT